MPSTFTGNLQIEKMATGEKAGQWGSITNTNFDLLDQAVDGVIDIALTTAGDSANPTQIDIDQGAVSDGRNMSIRFTSASDLGGTAFVQLNPSTVEKVGLFRNDLSDDRGILIFQGDYDSSRDFFLANGKDAILKFDGGGTSSATVSNAFSDVTFASLTSTGLTDDATDTVLTLEGGGTDASDVSTARLTLAQNTTADFQAGSAKVSIGDGGVGGTTMSLIVDGTSFASYNQVQQNLLLEAGADVRITADNVGINDTSPSAELSIKDSSPTPSSSTTELNIETDSATLMTAKLTLSNAGVNGEVGKDSGQVGGVYLRDNQNDATFISFASGDAAIFTAGSRVLPDFKVTATGNVEIKNDLTIENDLTAEGDLTQTSSTAVNTYFTQSISSIANATWNSGVFNDGDYILTGGAGGTVYYVSASSGSVTYPAADITLTNGNLTVVGSSEFNGRINEQEYSLTGTDIDPDNGTIQYKTLSGNTTFTESLSNGDSVTLMIDIGSAITVTFPTTRWVGGNAPALEITSGNGYNIIEFWKVQGNLYGAFVGAAT